MTPIWYPWVSAQLALAPLEVAGVAFVAIDGLDRYERVPHPEEYALLLTSIGGHVKNLTCPI